MSVLEVENINVGHSEFEEMWSFQMMRGRVLPNALVLEEMKVVRNLNYRKEVDWTELFQIYWRGDGGRRRHLRSLLSEIGWMMCHIGGLTI